MKYEDVVLDIKKLVGLKLDSIKPGAEIIIKEVDQEQDRIEIETASGVNKTRPLSEIRRIWQQLCKSPAVHVDKILGGSGSSRNQPETILANLPYVEWLRVDGKKHLAFTGEGTHPYGTLKRMDELAADEIRQRLRDGVSKEKLSFVVVVASDILQATKSFENTTGLPIIPISPGIYEQVSGTTRILLVSANVLNNQVEPGTYLVVKGTSRPVNSIPVQINGRELHVTAAGGLHLMAYL